MNELLEAVSRMDPEEALSKITEILGRLLADLDDEARERFLMNLIGHSEGDKISGMVHLCLAECMGEGYWITNGCLLMWPLIKVKWKIICPEIYNGG